MARPRPRPHRSDRTGVGAANRGCRSRRSTTARRWRFDAVSRPRGAGGFSLHPRRLSGMYTGRLWTMRQYAGFGSAAESNRRYRQLLAAGTTGLSVAFDLPTQMGYDSDDPMAAGEVGKVGVAIDSIDDMRTLFDPIPLDQVSTSMTINSPAALLLLMYQLVAEETGHRRVGAAWHGAKRRAEGVRSARYLHLPAAGVAAVCDRSLRLLQDRIAAVEQISVSGYHMAEAGATPVQEVAFTLAHAIEYVRAAQAAGLDVDEFAPRLTFFFVARTTLLEEVAKFRAARTDLGARHARRVRRTRPALDDAALPHPDRRRTTDRATTRAELGAGHVAGPGRGARWHPVAAHQRLRRSDRATDGEGRPVGVANATGAGVRNRPREDGRPLRRLVRDRVDDRRPRARSSRA